MDRLSALPDDLIFHILSFLPDPKILLQTSVLSKPWRFHWSHVPGFGFAKLIANNSNTFHDFESWIATAVARNIRYLVIDLKHGLTLPPCIFTSETLLYLRILFYCGSISTVHLPALKKLQLVNVSRACDFSLGHLLNGCPVLEELTIQRMNLEVCVLSSDTTTITTLDIDLRNSHTVLLVIPSLRYLRLRVSTPKRLLIRAWAMPFLIEADIDLMAAASIYDPPCMVTVFLGQLYNVKLLTLSTRQLMDIPTAYFSDWDVKFHNLTQLNLRTDWRFITCFLKSAENLRVLTILHMVDHDTQHWIEPKQVPKCLVSHLETLNLVDFGWSTQHEFDMVKYILKNAKALKRVEMICTRHCELDWNGKFDVIEKLGMFEIGSRDCELYINLD